MPRELWGEFDEPVRPVEPERTIPLSVKRAKLEEMSEMTEVAADKNIKIKVNSPIVTQTIEVMKQTEMLQALIDTYSNKSEFSNYLVNPCELIPDVDFPPENSADFFTDDKFTKPIWFMPPYDTPFVRGMPQHYAEINTEVCHAALRKAVCGQLRVAGFTDATDSALTLFKDAVEEFLRAFIREVRETQALDTKTAAQRDVDICTLEKAYFSMTNMSLMQVHNYYKHNLVERNRSEVAEFKEALNDYDKLMQQSQNMQKDEFKSDISIKMNEINNEFATTELQPQSATIVAQQSQPYFDINATRDLNTANANDNNIAFNNIQYAYAPQLQPTHAQRPL